MASMRTLLLLALTAALAAPADAQIRSLQDRARRLASDAVERVRSAEPATATSAETSASDNAPTDPNQLLPAIDLYDLLWATFYDNTGMFSTASVPLTAVFPADGDYDLAILHPDGRLVASSELTIQRSTTTPAFGILQSHGRFSYEPAPGDYQLAVRLDGAPIGAVPFTLRRTESDDPFDPVATWSVEGPWRTTGILWAPTDDADGKVTLTYWLSADEFTADRTRVREVLYRNGERVSAHESEHTMFASFAGWTVKQQQINGDNGGRRGTLDRSDFVDGDYRIEVGEEGAAPVRVFRFSVSGGQFVPHERSALDYTPRADFLTPRSLRRMGNSELRTPVDQVWMVSGE